VLGFTPELNTNRSSEISKPNTEIGNQQPGTPFDSHSSLKSAKSAAKSAKISN